MDLMVETTTTRQRVTGANSMITCLAPYFSVSSSSSTSTSWSDPGSGGPALPFAAIWRGSEAVKTVGPEKEPVGLPAWRAGPRAGRGRGRAGRREPPGSLREPGPTSRCRSPPRCPTCSWPLLDTGLRLHPPRGCWGRGRKWAGHAVREDQNRSLRAAGDGWRCTQVYHAHTLTSNDKITRSRGHTHTRHVTPTYI